MTEMTYISHGFVESRTETETRDFQGRFTFGPMDKHTVNFF